MITRTIQNVISGYMHKGRAIIIYGPRRTGKTTILNKFSEQISNYLIINCDLSDGQELLNIKSVQDIELRFGKYDYLLIDEAQRIHDIGITLKAIVDNLPKLQLIVTGSSSLDLSNYTNEPLTGRKFEFIVPPLSSQEIFDYAGIKAVMSDLSVRLIYGNYPEVYLDKTMPEEIVKELAGSYLFKDLLVYQDIKRPDLLKKLLIALALQLGNEVSYNELASIVGMDKKTVERYISLLEQCFIIYRMGSFSRNLRNELKRANKVYFWDNGIRNALIGNFNSLEIRNDVGALWENYFITERRKYQLNRRATFDHYFWRTTTQQEIDLIEVQDAEMKAFEVKWRTDKQAKTPSAFRKSYTGIDVLTINPANYLTFVTD